MFASFLFLSLFYLIKMPDSSTCVCISLLYLIKMTDSSTYCMFVSLFSSRPSSVVYWESWNHKLVTSISLVLLAMLLRSLGFSLAPSRRTFSLGKCTMRIGIKRYWSLAAFMKTLLNCPMETYPLLEKEGLL